MRKFFQKFRIWLTSFLPNKSITYSKAEWNKLSDENHRYYIVSKEGRDISEGKFKELGEKNYKEIVLSDPLIKKNLSPFSDKRVLDIGCGVGRLSEFLADDFKRVDGIDISEKMIEKASQRLGHLNNVHFHVGDGMHYPLENNSIDFVFSYIVFQHMPSVAVIKENFKEVKRVLKPSGIAKVQIRGGKPIRKNTWNYGPSFNQVEAQQLMDDVGLNVVKFGDDSIKRFFLWLSK